MEHRPVILQLTSAVGVQNKVVCTDRLSRYGLVVVVCADFTELLERIRTIRLMQDVPVVSVLEGRNAEDSVMVSTLRTLHLNVGIVVLVDPGDEAGIIRHLHSGANNYCAADASPDLLVAVVLRLLQCFGVMSRGMQITPARLPDRSTAAWRLADRGWVLCSPDGQCLELTTGERAFISVLFDAPDQKATHAELIDAVNTSYNLADGRTHQSRLGVLVSRLRRKFEKAGAPLPLKSIHNWGYMFGIESHQRAD